MARSFSKPGRLHVMNELNVTPMLDLCFCLLIIFMIATPVLEQTTAVGNKPVTKAQLEAEFAAIAALPEAEQPIVRIRGDGAQVYQNIIDLLSLAKTKGLTKVGLDSETR